VTNLITREQKLAESVQRYGRARLAERGYPMEKLRFVDEYPWGVTQLEPGVALIASGFDLDDEGRLAELGSDLIERQYTIQFWTFAATEVLARNVAQALKFALERDGLIPLLDIAVDGSPEIDRVVVDGVTAERQVIPNPEPWQENVWTTTLTVTDTYSTRLI
jgi:hypothetical protein